MKNEIHPKLNNIVFIDVNTKQEFITKSTISSDKTKKINGEDYFVIDTQISSSSHPFYTGKHRIVDTENLVKKFEKKQQKATKLSDLLKQSKEKKSLRKSKVNEVKESKSLTLKDMLKQMQ